MALSSEFLQIDKREKNRAIFTVRLTNRLRPKEFYIVVIHFPIKSYVLSNHGRSMTI